MCKYANVLMKIVMPILTAQPINILAHYHIGIFTTRCKDKKRGVNCQAIHAPFLYIKDKLSIRSGYFHQNNAYISYT